MKKFSDLTIFLLYKKQYFVMKKMSMCRLGIYVLCNGLMLHGTFCKSGRFTERMFSDGTYSVFIDGTIGNLRLVMGCLAFLLIER